MSYSIGFDIFAKDKASAVFNKLGDSVKDSEGKFSKFKTSAVVGAAAATTAVVGFAKSSVDKFKEVGGETLGLMRVMGGTAESASRMRFAAQMTGVSYETLAKSTGKFSKALDAAKGSPKAMAAMVKTLGTNFLDAHGHILPMGELLPKVADKFAKMPAGAEKTALAMKLFGKAGTDMLPMLNKGKDGLLALEKSSDKYGLTLSGKMLDNLKKSKAGQREWNATLDGLKVQFGAQVLPILTQFTTLIRDKVIPLVQKVTGFFRDHAGAVKIAAVAVGLIAAATAAHSVVLAINSGALSAWILQTKVVQVATKAWAAVQWVLNAAMSANPIALVVIALAALAVGIVYAWKHSETFRRVVTGAFNAVKNVVMGVFNWFKNNWPLLLAILTGPIGLAVFFIVRNFDKIVGFVTGLPKRIGKAAAGMWDGVKGAFKGVINWIIGAWNGLSFSIHIPKIHIPGTNSNIGGGDLGFGVPQIPYLKDGGVVKHRPGGRMVVVGEGGRDEAVIPLDRAGLSHGGGSTVVNVYVNGQFYGAAKDLAKVMVRELQQLKGQGVKLGLA